MAVGARQLDDDLLRLRELSQLGVESRGCVEGLVTVEWRLWATNYVQGAAAI